LIRQCRYNVKEILLLCYAAVKKYNITYIPVADLYMWSWGRWRVSEMHIFDSYQIYFHVMRAKTPFSCLHTFIGHIRAVPHGREKSELGHCNVDAAIETSPCQVCCKVILDKKRLCLKSYTQYLMYIILTHVFNIDADFS